MGTRFECVCVCVCVCVLRSGFGIHFPFFCVVVSDLWPSTSCVSVVLAGEFLQTFWLFWIHDIDAMFSAMKEEKQLRKRQKLMD